MSKIIRLENGSPEIVEDGWTLRRLPEAASSTDHSRDILPLAHLVSVDGTSAEPAIRAVWLGPDDDFEAHIPLLLPLDLIAVEFPSFRDGRGYSIATLLRSRYGFTGELRAVGDVLRDQLNYMRRCGFDAFAVRADKDIQDAIKSFSHYTVRYQGAVDNPEPLFRRRLAS